MNKYVTVVVFRKLHHAQIIQSKLANEGFTAILPNESINQAFNFITDSFGGYHVDVLSNEAQDAYDFLVECGDIIENPKEENNFKTALDKATKDYPIIANWSPDQKILALLFLLALVFFSVVLFMYVLEIEGLQDMFL